MRVFWIFVIIFLSGCDFDRSSSEGQFKFDPVSDVERLLQSPDFIWDDHWAGDLSRSVYYSDYRCHGHSHGHYPMRKVINHAFVNSEIDSLYFPEFESFYADTIFARKGDCALEGKTSLLISDLPPEKFMQLTDPGVRFIVFKSPVEFPMGIKMDALIIGRCSHVDLIELFYSGNCSGLCTMSHEIISYEKSRRFFVGDDKELMDIYSHAITPCFGVEKVELDTSLILME